MKAEGSKKRGRSWKTGAGGGYLTVFLVLSMTALLGVIYVLIYGAQIGAGRMRTERTASIAGDALLGEFHKELLSRYDLFFIDTSYLEAEGSVEKTEAHLLEYAEKNIVRRDVLSAVAGRRDLSPLQIRSAKITQYRLAVDQSLAPIREQVYAYMTADPAGKAAAYATGIIDSWEGIGIDLQSWKNRREESEQAYSELMESVRGEGGGNVSLAYEGEFAAEETEGMSADVVAAAIENFHFIPVLDQVYKSGSVKYSGRSIDTKNLCSHRKNASGTGFAPADSHGYPEANELLFGEYILEKFGCFTDPREDTALAYEIEYILSGKSGDRENLEAAGAKILLIRDAVNAACLFADEGRQGKVKLCASVIGFLLGVPEAEEVISAAITFVWAHTESLQDLRILLDGGKVPLAKTKEKWNTSIYNIVFPGTREIPKSGQSGIDYRDHLRILLFLAQKNTKMLRTADMIEANIRCTSGKEYFSLDKCIDAFRCRIETENRNGLHFSAETEKSYN